MKALRVPPIYKCIGLCDADLLDNGSRHPNLVLMKIAGFRRTRQTLWRAVQMLTQNCCQTIHEEWYVFDSFHLCTEAFDF